MKLTFRLFLIFALCSTTWAQKPDLTRDTQGPLPISRLKNATNYPGVEIGAQVNAEIAALPGHCGDVFVPSGTFPWTTTIVKSRCVRIHGESASSTILNWTPSTGVAIAVGDVLGAGAGTNAYPEGDISDLTLQGPSGALGATTIGIYIGGDAIGSTYGMNTLDPSGNFGDHTNYNRLRITGFGTGVQWGNNAWSNVISQSLISGNGTGVSYPAGISGSGESLSFVDTSIQNNSVGINQVGFGFFHFTHCRFDYNTTGGTIGFAQFYGNHFEQSTGTLLTIAATFQPVVIIDGGEAMLLASSGTDARMFYVNSSLNPTFIMRGTYLDANAGGTHSVTNAVDWNGSGANPVLWLEAAPYYAGNHVTALTNATCNFWGCHIADAELSGEIKEGSSLNVFGGLTVSGVKVLGGAVDPSAGGGVAAPQGSLYLRTNGGVSTTLYVKTAAGDTAWTAK